MKYGVSWISHSNSVNALAPLRSDNKLDVIEWTVDLHGFGPMPPLTEEILNQYAAKHSLLAHGVHYSVLSAGYEDRRIWWAQQLAQDPYLSNYSHLSVHFGFSSGWKIKHGSPMPAPFTQEALDVGRRNLQMLADVVPCPLGLENLPAAFSKPEALEQGMFIDKLLDPFDGFLMLDLHNLYCLSHNFQIDFMDLLRTYPLHRVRQIHVSGGSWVEFPSRPKNRRDSHDDRVPQIIYDHLDEVCDLCPDLEYIILEQLPSALKTDQQQAGYREDFLKLRERAYA